MRLFAKFYHPGSGDLSVIIAWEESIKGLICVYPYRQGPDLRLAPLVYGLDHQGQRYRDGKTHEPYPTDKYPLSGHPF